MKAKTKLFLHMGPGFHSLIEASMFASKIPEMEFWNQPKTASFADLVTAASEVFLNLKQGKVDLYAHSFGAHLALRLVQKFPDKVGKVVILNSAVNPFSCFLNVGSKLNVLNATEVKALKSGSSDAKMEAIFKVATSSGFNSVYWYSAEKQKQIESNYFSQFPSVDLTVFSSVFKDFLDQQASERNVVSWNGPVRVIYSENDALLTYTDDVAPWKHVFPNVTFENVKGVGHYAHLESAAVADKFFLLGL